MVLIIDAAGNFSFYSSNGSINATYPKQWRACYSSRRKAISFL